MLEFELSYFRKTRVWFKGEQKFLIPSDDTESKKYKPVLNKLIVNKAVIIELFIPAGARYSYGLLGANYESTSSGDLEVSVSNSNFSTSKILSDSLISKVEMPKLCLLPEYRGAIFNKIDYLADQERLNFSGKLNFCYGAVADISSNMRIFSTLTSLVLNIFHIPENELDADLLVSLIDATN